MDVESIRESIRAWLKARKICFSQYESGAIQCLFRGKQTGYIITFGSISERGFSVLGATGKFVPKEFLAQAFEHACAVNFERLSTTLEIDPRDGEWRVRIHISLLGASRLPRTQLDWALEVVRTELIRNLRPLQQGLFDKPEESILGSEEEDEEEDEQWEIQDEELRRIVEGEE